MGYSKGKFENPTIKWIDALKRQKAQIVIIRLLSFIYLFFNTLSFPKGLKLGICITGCGKAQPGLVVRNEDLEKIVDTSDEWIFTRTGIKERRISVNESTTDLAEAASLMALGMPSKVCGEGVNIDMSGKAFSEVAPEEIDLIILTTITPDVLVPSQAAALKKRLGAANAIAFDLNAACTGFIYGLSVAESMMVSSHTATGSTTNMKPINRAIIVSSERMSRITNWQDRGTCVLFGDGAGAIVVEWSDNENNVLSMYMENTDDEGNSLTCLQSFDSPLPFNAGGPICEKDAFEKHLESQRDSKTIDYSYLESLELECDPATPYLIDEFELGEWVTDESPKQFVYMNGQKVFKFASKAMEHAVKEAAELAGVEINDIDLVVPHQANYRIIEYAAKRLKMPIDKFQISIDKTGNSSSSCLPMALSDAFVDGRISEGSIICLVAFGGGLTAGASILKI